MTEREQLKELCANLNQRTVIVPALNAETQEVEMVEEVFQEYAFALVIGVDLVPGATSWSERYHTPTWFGLWFLMLCVEWGELGSPYIDVSKQASPLRYDAVVNALARLFQHMSESGDDKLIKDNVRGIQFVNKVQVRDIQDAVLKVRDTKKKKDTAEKETGAKGKKKKAKTDLEAEQVVRELTTPVQPAPVVATPPIQGVQTRFEALCASQAPLNIQKSLLSTTPQSGDYNINDIFPVPQETSKNSIPKVTMTVTPCKNKEEVVVGYLIRFFQHDPQWNPGQMIYTLIKQKREREMFGSRPNYTEPWPQYIHLFGDKQFPLFNMSLGAWYEYIGSMNGGTKTSFDAFTRNNAEDRVDDHKNPGHPKNVCTLDRALSRLKGAGATHTDPGLFSNGASTASFPVRTVRYLPIHVFWDHNKYVGLVSQYFPYAWSENLVGLSAESMSALKTTERVDKLQIVSNSAKALPYKTYNNLSHLAADADTVYARVSRTFPNQCYQHYVAKTLDKKAYEAYRVALRDATSVCMQKFCSTVQLHGNTGDLPVSPAVKAAIEWLKEHQKTHDTISVKREIYDPDLDIYSNHIIGLVTMYAKLGKVLHPHFLLLMHFLFSTYRRGKDGLSFNVLIYGGRGDGKSELTKYLDSIGIRGTFTAIGRTTGAADETDTQIHDEIRMVDEQDQAIMASKPSGQDQKVVLKKQIAMTDKRLTLKESSFIQVPGHGKMRASKLVNTAQEYTEVSFSNIVPDEKNAIMDRYHRSLLVRSDIPFEEMAYSVDESQKAIVRELFSTMQFQTMMIIKAMDTFAIPCRTPFMGIHDGIMARMTDALRTWGVISANDGGLGRYGTRVRHAVYIMAVERAAICTWHIPGAIHYGKKYDHSQLIDCAPFLYVTPKMTLRAVTTLASEIVKVEYNSILQAVAAYILNKPYDTTKTPLDYFFEDDLYPIKKETNPNYDRVLHGQRHKQLADLNYVEINYPINDVAYMISERTKNPHINANEVMGILRRMADFSFVPKCNGKRNGYVRQKFTLDDLKDRHRGTLTPKHILGLDTRKETISRMCDGIAEIYYLDVLKRLTDIPPFDYATFQRGAQILSKLTSQDIVSLYVIQDHIRSTSLEELMGVEIVILKKTLEDAGVASPSPNEENALLTLERKLKEKLDAFESIQGEEQREIARGDICLAKSEVTKARTNFLTKTLFLSLEEMNRVWNAFPGIVGENDKKNFTRQEMFLLLFGLREGYIMERGTPAKYLKRTIVRDGDYPRFASEADIPMLNNVPFNSAEYAANTIKLVEIFPKKVCVSLMGLEVVDRNILINAFNFAALSSHTTPGKILMGWPDDNDTTKLQTVKWSQEEIDRIVHNLDQHAPPGAVSRTTGIPFKRREVSTSGEEFLLTGKRQQPTEALPKAIEIVRDMEEYAATQQHLICGRPLDEPVRTEKYIREHIYKGQVGDLDYPNAIIKEQQRIASVQWEPNSAKAFKSGKSITQNRDKK
jgi:hypothetical protein